MKTKFLITSLLLTIFNCNIAYSSFEYNGTFYSNRKANEVQSFYVLLNKNDNISFSFKCNGKSSNEVIVKSIKLTSEDNIGIKSDSGVKTYKVPNSGIYEISVCSSTTIKKDIIYELTVDKIVEKKEENKEEKKEENKEKKEESIQKVINKEINKENLKGDFEEVPPESIDTEKNIETKKTIEVNNKVKDDNETNEKKVNNIENTSINNIKIDDKKTILEKDTNISKNNNNSQKSPLIENKQNKQEEDVSIVLEEESLGPDTVAYVDNSDDNDSYFKLNYDGNLKLVKSLDAYKFIGDKNKCWPKSIIYDDNNNLWVLDAQLYKVTGFDNNSKEIISFGSKGSEKYNFGLPCSLALFKNYILVGDRQKRCVHIFDKKGNWQNSINSDPNVGLIIINPVSITIRNNEIWIADNGTNRVLCFNSNFSFLGSFGSSNESKINSITAITSDKDYIYLLEEEGSLKKFGTMGNLISEISTNLPYSSGLIVDLNDNLWITNIDSEEAICSTKDGKELFSVNKENIKDILKSKSSFSPTSIAINKKGQIAISDSSSKQILIFELR